MATPAAARPEAATTKDENCIFTNGRCGCGDGNQKWSELREREKMRAEAGGKEEKTTAGEVSCL